MKYFTAIIVTCIVGLTPAVSSAHGGYNNWRSPPVVVRERGMNPWPFIAGAVIGGIVVHAAESRRPTPIPSDAVLVNGVWMRRVQQCYQNIVTDYRGDQHIENTCNYIYVPVE